MGCGGGRSFIPYPYPIPSGPAPDEQRQSTKDILKMRLARGEITVEKYHEMLRVLQGDAKTSPQEMKSHIRRP